MNIKRYPLLGYRHLPQNDNEYTAIAGMNPGSSYDVHGNFSGYGTKAFVYDWRNRLSEVRERVQVIAQYTYDALNRRMSKATPVTSGVTTYFYDNAQVIEEHEQAVFKRAYVYGQYVDDVLIMESEGQTYYYLKEAAESGRVHPVSIIPQSGFLVLLPAGKPKRVADRASLGGIGPLSAFFTAGVHPTEGGAVIPLDLIT